MVIEIDEAIFLKIKEVVVEVGKELLATQTQSIIKNINKKDEYKNDPQIHTNGDVYSEKRITDLLKPLSTYPIFTEETGVKVCDSKWVWILDPIDGSTQYHLGLPLFTISIALCHGENYDPYWGLVYAPSLNLLYEAKKGKGAFCNGHKIKNISNKSIDQIFISISAYRSFERVKKIHIFNKIIKNMKQIRQFGCPSLDICFVAESKLDARIIAGCKIWDIAAAYLIASESNTKMLDPISSKKASLASSITIIGNSKTIKKIILHIS